MQQMTTYEHLLGDKRFTAILFKGEPHWLLPEIERALNYAPKSLAKYIADSKRWGREFKLGRDYQRVEGKMLRDLKAALAGGQNVNQLPRQVHTCTLLSRRGLELTLMKSDKPLAEEYRAQLLDVVIPEMRRLGLLPADPAVVDGQIVDRAPAPKPVNGTHHPSHGSPNEETLTAEELYIRWCDGELRGARLLPQEWEIAGVAPEQKEGEECVAITVNWNHQRLRYRLDENIRIRHRDPEPETKKTSPAEAGEAMAAGPLVSGYQKVDSSTPTPRIARGSGPISVNEVVTHQLGLAICELESGQTDPVRTALRLELAEHVSGRDLGRYRDRLLASDFDDQTTVERPAVTSQLAAETRHPNGILEMAVEQLRGYLRTVRSAGWKEAAEATGLRRYLMKAAVAHMAASGELDRSGSQLALNSKVER